jgi:dTDP-4-dehydrorhamnose reductase
MKILITGAFGQLGNSLKNFLSINDEVFRTGLNIPTGGKGLQLNIVDKIMLKDIISSISPDVIINLAALTNVDFCESNPEIAKEVNTNGVQNLVDVFSGKIIHLSTDYVFDGLKGPYKEEDQINPISVYGKTKYDAEKIVLDKNNNLVLRANVLYNMLGNNKASFLNWVVNNLKNKNSIQVVNDQFNNPTWTESIAEILVNCLNKDMSGLYHWGDQDYLSRYDFAIKIAESYNLKSDLIKQISTSQLKQMAPRPLNGGLDQSKLKKYLNIIPPSINDCLDAIRIKEMK